MATYDYSSITATAENLLRKFGSPITLERPQGVHDPVAGTVTAPTALKSKAVGLALTRYKGQILDSYDDAFRQGLVTGKSILFMVNGVLDRVPAPGDFLVTAQSVRWEVLGVTALNPSSATKAIVYYLGLKR